MTVDWKRTTIFGVSYGVTIALAVSVIFGLFLWYNSRQKAWDSDTVRYVSGWAYEQRESDEGEIRPTSVEFGFVLENTTGHDYTVSETAKLYERLKSSSALQPSSLGELVRAYKIPARDRAEILIRVDYDQRETCFDKKRYPCYKERFDSTADFVLLDDVSRTRITMPIPAALRNGSLVGITSNSVPA